MQEIINQILTEGGVTALERLVLLLIVGGVVYTLSLITRQRKSDYAAAQVQTNSLIEVIRDLSETNKANAANAVSLRDALTQMSAFLQVHHQQAADIKTAFERTAAVMTTTSDQRGTVLEALPGQVAGKVSEVMVDELKKLPGEISAEINPALAEIASQVKALSEKIEKVVPSQIKELVTPEFEELKAKVNRLLAIMDQQQNEPKAEAAVAAEEKPNE